MIPDTPDNHDASRDEHPMPPEIAEFVRDSAPWPHPPRDPGRIPELLRLLGEVWSHPAHRQERFGQFVVNLIRHETPNMTPEDIERRLWNIEDTTIRALLEDEHDRLSCRNDTDTAA